MTLKEDASVYEVFHEMGHLNHWKHDPQDYFLNGGTANREQKAYDFVRETFGNKLSDAEQVHAFEYVIKSGGTP